MTDASGDRQGAQRASVADDHATTEPPSGSPARLDRRLAAGVVIVIVAYLGWRAWQPAQPPGAGNAAQSSNRSAGPGAPDYKALINDEGFHILLGMAYADGGLLDQALFEQREALRVNARSVPALNNVGFYSLQKGDYPAAIAALEEALRIDPAFALARNNLKGVYAKAIETAPNEQARNRYREQLRALDAAPGPTSGR